MLRFPRLLRRFGRSEKGQSTVEFAVTFPVVLTIFLSGIELGFVHLHHSMLERALDITVRDIRLGTGTAPQHDDIKDLICERAGFINDCSDSLRLEMIELDPRSWSGFASDADCIDKSEDVQPVRSFVNGQENRLMILRACAVIDPVFPTSGLGKAMVKDKGSGEYALISMSAFVQEPE